MLLSAFDLRQMLRATSIEVYECDETAVRTPKGVRAPRFAQLATKSQDLWFRGVQLAHAVVKADYLDRRNLLRPGLGFLLQAQDILKPSSNTITLQDDLGSVFNDFSLTSLVGRIGQGLTILYAQERQKMRFVAHLQSYWAAQNGGIRDKTAAADFVFSRGNETFLFESKGSFTLEDNNASAIRRRLREALARQIDPWMTRLTPAPKNGYAVYSCLRESSWERSAMFVTDPPEDGNGAADVPLTPEQTRRENYAAWLRAMGLNGASQRLVGGPSTQGELREEEFFVQETDGRRYAFRMYGRWPISAEALPVVIGLDLDVLKSISEVLQSPKEDMPDTELNLSASPFQQSAGVSVFPDGSVFGLWLGERLEVVRIPL